MRTKFSRILTLFMAFVVQLTFAQEKTITGTVTDAESGMPLIGVSVIIEGTRLGTQTDFDGNYSLEASTGQNLVFTYVGYGSETIEVGSNTSIDVTLSQSTAQLGKVVVTAFGIERPEESLTYVTESVGGEELSTAAPTSAASALAGKVAGLQINTTSNGVNPDAQIILRGTRSISGSNEALIVIDGAIASAGAFSDINAANIKTINVLKGATAAALYGSRAANGALIVTTKNGSSIEGDGFQIGINSSTTFEEVAYMPDFQDKFGSGIQGQYVPFENTNWGPRFDGVTRRIGPILEDGRYQQVPFSRLEDNLKNFYSTGLTMQNMVYFSGADDNSNMYIAVGDQTTTGIVPGDKYNSNTFRMNASQELGDLTLSVNSAYAVDETHVHGANIGTQDRSLYWFILNTVGQVPLENYSDWRTDEYASPNGYYNAYYQNPYWGVDTNRDNDESTRLFGNIAASWDISDWLNFSTRLGINRATQQGEETRTAQTYTDLYSRPDPVASYVTASDFQSLIYTTSTLLTGDFEYNDFGLNAILGAASYTSQSRSSSIGATNLSIPGFFDISNGTGDPNVSLNEEVNKTYGFFLDLTFDYKDYLFLHVSGRQDYTSTLSPDNNSYFYPSVGVSAVLTDMFPSLDGDVLSFLKITASNSTVYNDLRPYAINPVFQQVGGFPYGTINGFRIGGTAIDPDIKKEKLQTTEVSASLAFFSNRLTLDATAYRTITSNLITFTTPGPASGAGAFLTNIGELEGKGIGITLGAKILDMDDFGWNLNVNFSSQETVVNSIKPGLTEIAVADYGTYGIYAVVGQEFPLIKATAYVRDDQGRVAVDPISGNPVVGGQKIMGEVNPDYTVGLTSSLRVYDFTLSATMDYRTGHVYYSQLADAMAFTGRSVISAAANRQDFVWPNSVILVTPATENSPAVFAPNNNVPITGGRQSFWINNYDAITENYVRDATALKLRELALNYHVPSDLLDQTFINTMTIGLVGRNLITWLPAENRFSDPEFQNSDSAINNFGVSGFSQSPPTRSYGFSINVEF